MGVDSLLEILKKRFWWPGMRKDVKQPHRTNTTKSSKQTEMWCVFETLE
jgi:hypothetical protein